MTRVYMENPGHIKKRIQQRFANDERAQKRMVDAIKQIEGKEAPSEAVGHYSWYVEVERTGRILIRGHAIRTVYSYNESYPNSTKYRLAGGQFVRA